MKKREIVTGTIEENMNMALQQEQIAIDCGIFDPYYPIAIRNVAYYLDCAAALERGEKDIETRY
jgi:hypothetical protein